MGKPDDKNTTSLKDVKQLGLFAAIASLGYVFWVVGAMEMVERLAYYGVKAVAALYATQAEADGGLGVSAARFGVLLSIWALVQSILPVFTGGLSDRFGYKLTIFISTVVKILGYLTMALFRSYEGFFLGAIVLAAGTAIFKPGIQGTLVKTTNRQNSSMAWGLFYQTVNIGGFLGPIVASFIRESNERVFADNPSMAWAMVFFVCAGIISLNFLLLLTYREPGKEERLERLRIAAEQKEPHNSAVAKWVGEFSELARTSIRELLRPHVFIYLIIFSGFWFMFNALFDVLPLHIRDWVDRSDIMNWLFGGQTDNGFFKFLFGMNKEGTDINPEGLLNLNAGMIMLTCFFFAYLSGKMRATTSMVVGTLLASVAMIGIGHAMTGWFMVAMIATFSIGEMLSSPKFLEFIGNFAPTDKKAMYLGFSQIPLAIGWTAEGFLGPWLYGQYASKDRFSRVMLEDRLNDGTAAVPTETQLQSWSDTTEVSDRVLERMKDATPEAAQADPAGFVESIPQGEAFQWLDAMTPESSLQLTRALADANNIATVWYIMAGVGLLTAVGIVLYGKWILTVRKDDD